MAGGLKTRKKQRLYVVSTALVALFAAVLLVVFAFQREGAFDAFRQPSAVKADNIPAGQRFRLGGMVKDGSFSRQEDGLTYGFTVTDCVVDINVSFKGILPDLFREGQGVITEGRLDDTGLFVADTVLAKHDENYVPAGSMPKDMAACEHPDEIVTGEAGV
jgi:cytochrome c-type biogenesis protein CcmE